MKELLTGCVFLITTIKNTETHWAIILFTKNKKSFSQYKSYQYNLLYTLGAGLLSVGNYVGEEYLLSMVPTSIPTVSVLAATPTTPWPKKIIVQTTSITLLSPWHPHLTHATRCAPAPTRVYFSFCVNVKQQLVAFSFFCLVCSSMYNKKKILLAPVFFIVVLFACCSFTCF